MKRYIELVIIILFFGMILIPTISGFNIKQETLKNVNSTSVIYDHFNDDNLDENWQISFSDYADGWIYIESGTDLTVTDINNTVVNPNDDTKLWSRVYLTQNIFPMGNFTVDFDISWNSEGDNKAMQRLYIILYSKNYEEIAGCGYNDVWVYRSGSKIAWINDSYWSSGYGTLPLTGDASIRIVRYNDIIIFYWDGKQIFSGFSSILVEKVQISFDYLAFDLNYQGNLVSFFGSESVDLISVEGEIISNPPSTPTVDGPITGKPGVSYEYTFTTTDPDDDPVFYYVDWGDTSVQDWFGPFDSGKNATATHTWSQGHYEIKVKAKDTNNAVSEWSDPFPITMPRDKAINNPFLNFLQGHPILFPLLQKLIHQFGL